MECSEIGKGTNFCCSKNEGKHFPPGDAVSSARKGQKTPEGYYNLEDMLTELIGQGAEVIACGTRINAED